MQPTIGRFVHYTLTEQDVSIITGDRLNGTDEVQRSRHNFVAPGQTYPALVVRNFGGDAVNLQVFLDGTDTYWATSRTEGEPGEQGRWIWPPRV